MIKYNIEVLDMFVTEWNEESQDWSGNEFSKGGFHLGVAKSNNVDDILEVINTMFEVNKKDLFIDEDDKQTLQFSVVEDRNAMQDDNGHYLVDYIIGVYKIESVNINVVDIVA